MIFLETLDIPAVKRGHFLCALLRLRATANSSRMKCRFSPSYRIQLFVIQGKTEDFKYKESIRVVFTIPQHKQLQGYCFKRARSARR